MGDITVRAAPRARRRAVVGLGAFALVLTGVCAVPSVTSHSALPMLIGVPAVWLPCALYMMHLVAGTTRVSESGLRLRGLFIRGFIPWSEVTAIKKRTHPSQGTNWSTAEVHQASGKKRRLPGFYSEGDPEFEKQLQEVREMMRGVGGGS